MTKANQKTVLDLLWAYTRVCRLFYIEYMRGCQLVARLQEFHSCYRGFESRQPLQYMEGN